MITRTINVIRRYIFYLILGGLGLVSSLLQWGLFQHAIPQLYSGWGLFAFLVMPFTYVIPNICEKYMPTWLNRIMVTIGGYWLLLTYYATLLLLGYLVLWTGFQIWTLIRSYAIFTYMNLWELIGKMYAWCTIAILAYIGVKAWYTAKHLIMNHIDIHVNKHLSRDYIVAFASDLHFGMVLGKSFGHRLVKDMNALHPDVLPCFALSKCSVMVFPKIVILLLYPLVA